MKVFSAIGQWLLSHPICFALISLAIGCAVSVFSLEIRQFLKTRPQTIAHWTLNARVSSIEERLQLLARLHDDPIQLILYLGRAACLGFAGLMLLVFIAVAMEFRATRGKPLTHVELLLLQFGIYYGVSLGMGFVGKLLFRIMELRSYSGAVKRLEAKAESLKLRLAPKHPPSHHSVTGTE